MKMIIEIPDDYKSYGRKKYEWACVRAVANGKEAVEVKGWARIGPVTGVVLASEEKVLINSVPCTIHIKAADYARLKGER